MRDQEKTNTKERLFYREDGQWNLENQLHKLLNLFNMNKKFGEHFRVFSINKCIEKYFGDYTNTYSIEL